jgi:hypothetical protein
MRRRSQQGAHLRQRSVVRLSPFELALATNALAHLIGRGQSHSTDFGRQGNYIHVLLALRRIWLL